MDNHNENSNTSWKSLKTTVKWVDTCVAPHSHTIKSVHQLKFVDWNRNNPEHKYVCDKKRLPIDRERQISLSISLSLQILIAAWQWKRKRVRHSRHEFIHKIHFVYKLQRTFIVYKKVFQWSAFIWLFAVWLSMLFYKGKRANIWHVFISYVKISCARKNSFIRNVKDCFTMIIFN